MHQSISETYVSGELYVFAQYTIHILNESTNATATFWVIFAITWICFTTNIVYIFLEEHFVVRHFATTFNN